MSVRMQVQSLTSLTGLRIQPCHKLRCRSKMWLGSGIAVAGVQAGSWSSDSMPSLGTAIPRMQLLKKKKRKKEKKRKKKLTLKAFSKKKCQNNWNKVLAVMEEVFHPPTSWKTADSFGCSSSGMFVINQAWLITDLSYSEYRCLSHPRRNMK